ncbi:hypothetical protein GBF38_003222 [Nibea albiflora]|uniref:Uncharacterized protein n=1 Tax=Nibea albiflora TaxID=240163 RepID=A0ACB7FJP8_NIBAL|nr:hypothetical protein GBF38_003222 [Nibea albiflora]
MSRGEKKRREEKGGERRRKQICGTGEETGGGSEEEGRKQEEWKKPLSCQQVLGLHGLEQLLVLPHVPSVPPRSARSRSLPLSAPLSSVNPLLHPAASPGLPLELRRGGMDAAGRGMLQIGQESSAKSTALRPTYRPATDLPDRTGPDLALSLSCRDALRPRRNTRDRFSRFYPRDDFTGSTCVLCVKNVKGSRAPSYMLGQIRTAEISRALQSAEQPRASR